MVEINNQRKAFLDILVAMIELMAVSEINHGTAAIIGEGKLFADYSDHPRKLVTLNPKLKSTGAGLPASFRWWDAYRKRKRPERLLSEKSGRCGIAAD